MAPLSSKERQVITLFLISTTTAQDHKALRTIIQTAETVRWLVPFRRLVHRVLTTNLLAEEQAHKQRQITHSRLVLTLISREQVVAEADL
jgi:undecaprenyl pyrophosphate phosphatase UppP